MVATRPTLGLLVGLLAIISGILASSCPRAAPNYTAFPGSCIGTDPASQNCAPTLKVEVACSAGLAGCFAKALAACNDDPECHSFGLDVGPKCTTEPGHPMKWQTFGEHAAVPSAFRPPLVASSPDLLF